MVHARLSVAGRFFAMTLLFSLPLYFCFLLIGLGALSADIALPLVTASPLPPLLAALAVTPRGQRGRLLRRAVDWTVLPHRGWFLSATVLVPAVLVIAMLLLWAVGVPIADGRAAVFMLPLLAVSFLFAAIGEELGWMGVAYEPMTARWGRTGGTVLLALLWVAWHLPFYVVTFPGPAAILAQATTVVALRFLMVRPKIGRAHV